MINFMHQYNYPQNNNPQIDQPRGIKNYRLLKCKGKPFWLNLANSRTNNYQKYKNQISQLQSFREKETTDDTTSKIKQTQSEEQYLQLESVQSFNQNYQEDFQSYKSTINQKPVKQKIQRIPQFHTKNLPIRSKIYQIQPSTHRQSNNSSLSRKLNTKVFKNMSTKNVKTEQSLKSQSFSLTKELFMIENTMYLRNQNQKILRRIQQMRKLLPMMIKNHQQITSQHGQINTLLDQVKRATSPGYQFGLQKSKSQIKVSQKLVESRIKKLSSPKNQRKIPTLLDDGCIEFLNPQQQVREKLLSKMRLHCLREEKSIQLQKKIHLYEQIISKLSTQQKIQSYTSLESRRVFLEWDLERKKNQFDLKHVQENLVINELHQEISHVNSLIQEKQQDISELQKINQCQKQKQIKLNHQKQYVDQDLTLRKQQFPVIESPKKQTKSFIIQRKQMKSPKIYTPTHPQSKSFFYKRFQKEAQVPLVNQRFEEDSLPQIQQKKSSLPLQQKSLRQRKQQNKSNLNLNIRIKQSAFRSATLNEDIEELIL